MIVLDTDVLILFLRGDPVIKKILFSMNEPFSTTVINAYELLRGATTIKRRKVIEDLLGSLTILPLDEKSVFKAVEIYLFLKEKGLPVNEMDILIAAITVAKDAKLYTRNVKHFSRIPSLELVNVSTS